MDIEQAFKERDEYVAAACQEWAFRGLEYRPLEYSQIWDCQIAGLDTSECIGVGLDVYSGVSLNDALDCLSI